MPNSELWGTKIINYTRSDPRMVRVTFGIAYEDDIATARKVLLEMVGNDERVNDEPAPAIYVSELGDNAVALELRAWTQGPNWVQLRFDVIERGKLALDAAGISIPFPQRDIHIKDGGREGRDLAGERVGGPTPARGRRLGGGRLGVWRTDG